VTRLRRLQYALIMVMDRHRERLLGNVLANYILIERVPDFCRLWHPNIGRLAPGVLIEFLVEDAFTNVYATVANINAQAGDLLAPLGVDITKKRAPGEVCCPGHIFPCVGKGFLSPGLGR